MNKNESKYFNTAVKMDKALVALLEKKDFEYITIKEICALAGVNRSTFYLHYENVYDLLEETTQYITDTFLSYFPEGDREYILKFYLTGITAVVMEWLKNDCAEEADNIIRIIIDCVVGKSNIN